MSRLRDLCFTILLVCGCGAQESSQPTETVSTADNGKTIAIRPGQSILIKLPAQFGTGYSWQLVNPKNKDLVIVERPPSESESPHEPGSTQTQVFRLSFTGSGEADVVLHYRRPWETSAVPLKTFRIKVESHR